MKMAKLYLIPYYREMPGIHPESPVLVHLTNIPGEHFVAIFTKEQDLHDAMRLFGVYTYKIKKVDDLTECITSIREAGVRVMMNPHVVDGSTRWTEICLDDEHEEFAKKPEVRKMDVEIP